MRNVFWFAVAAGYLVMGPSLVRISTERFGMTVGGIVMIVFIISALVWYKKFPRWSNGD